MRAALAAGAVFWNGGDFYADPNGRNSNHLLRDYFAQYPDDASKVVISIKGGVDPAKKAVGGDEANILRCINDTNAQLAGKKTLDIYQCARVDQKVPIEVTMRAFQKTIDAGQLRGVTLSEPSADTIRRAAKVMPIRGVEVEFSLFETSILDNDVAAACAENHIPVIAYSPLGRGFLTGQFKTPADVPKDFRQHMPRFQPGNFEDNLKLAQRVADLAHAKGVTTAQVAIAWVVAMGRRPGMPQFLPIPGATTEARVLENMKLAQLTDQEVEQLFEYSRKAEVKGTRYPGAHMSALYGDTPKEQ